MHAHGTAPLRALRPPAGLLPVRRHDENDKPRRRLLPVRLPHVHWFHWLREDPYSGHNLYACRCGVVRHGL